MHSLKRAIPRAYRDHRTREGRIYGAYLRAFIERFGGTVPDDVRPTLREAGRLAVDLERVNADLEEARQRNRRREQRQYRRQLVIMRTQLANLERRIEQRLSPTRRRSRGGPLFAGEDLA